MPTLYLLRHGALLPNPERRFIGQRDVPLSEQGRRQALFWRRELASVPFHAVWTSDLPRCREMTSLILQGRPLAADPDPAFREIALGSWDGLTMQEVEARFPGSIAERGGDFWHYVPRGGESFAMLARRVLAALLLRLEALPPGGSALLVAHAGVNRIVLMRYLALGMEDFFSLPQPHGACTVLAGSMEDFRAMAVLPEEYA